MQRGQNLLNMKPIKVYRADIDNDKLQYSSANTIASDETNIDVINENEDAHNDVLEKSENLQYSQSDNKVLEKTIALPEVKIESTVNNTENNLSISDTKPRKLTRKEMIDRAVAAGMPREDAERMQPLKPGMFDKDVKNTLSVIERLIDGIQSGEIQPDHINTTNTDRIPKQKD